jgi:uncharacterized membrane protein YgcG
MLAASDALFKWGGGTSSGGEKIDAVAVRQLKRCVQLAEETAKGIDATGEARGDCTGSFRKCTRHATHVHTLLLLSRAVSRLSPAAVAAYFGIDHEAAPADSTEQGVASRMKLARQQLRDALLLQAKALCVLMRVDDAGDKQAVSEESASSSSSGGSSNGSGGSSSVSISALSPAASAFIACATKLRR